MNSFQNSLRPVARSTRIEAGDFVRLATLHRIEHQLSFGIAAGRPAAVGRNRNPEIRNAFRRDGPGLSRRQVLHVEAHGMPRFITRNQNSVAVGKEVVSQTARHPIW